MNNEIVVVNEHRQITPDVIKKAEALASKTARFLGMTDNVAVATFLKGWEIGFKMTTAPEFIQVIQGRPTLSPRGHLALLHNSGIFRNGGYLRAKHFNDANNVLSCTVSMKRGDSDVEYECTVSMEDARRAQLIKPDSGWEKWPANMLLWRATGFCADFVAPDVGGGMKRADEFGADITPDGDIIPGSWDEIPTGNDVLTLKDLQENYSIAEILASNDNKIPQTQEEIEAVAARLKVQNEESEDENE